MVDKVETSVIPYPAISRWHYIAFMLAIIDIGMLLFALTISLSFRFDRLVWSSIYEEHMRRHILSLPAAIALYLVAFWALHLYQCEWRHVGLEMLRAVVYANTIGTTGLVIVQRVVDGGTFPRSVLILVWILGTVFVGGVRVSLRMLSTQRQRSRSLRQASQEHAIHKRVVILGAGLNGARVLRVVQENPVGDRQVIGFLDDNPDKWGVYVGGAKVLGPLTMLNRLIAERAVDELIVATANTFSPRVRESVVLCRKNKLPVKVIPEFGDVVTGKAAAQLAEFSVEDLLRRPLVNADITEIGAYLSGKRVLVTGAGGSIGSELCRQIMVVAPDSLILVGHGENSIHQVYQELRSLYPDKVEHIHYAIASVSQGARIRQVIDHYRPQIVFHAAAHKHVPMMETNEQEAVQNNMLGTYSVSDACGWYGVERFVLISTDKAAAPCCVMGATKWLCEEIIQMQAALWPDTAYMTVRFGNVLGSRGSVVPMFREQIRRGGPVTVTHPEMTRFFMTIPEAVRLVLHAGGVGQTGKLYLLDMGEPVRILDIARDTILMHGMEPGVDIQIEFTGVRPGEKLHERLTSPAEQIDETSWEGLLEVERPVCYTPDELLEILGSFAQAAFHGTADDVRRLLGKAVKEMCDPETLECEFGARLAA